MAKPSALQPLPAFAFLRMRLLRMVSSILVCQFEYMLTVRTVESKRVFITLR